MPLLGGKQAEMNRLRAQNRALWDALREAHLESEKLTEKLEKLTVQVCCLEAENERTLKQLDILRGVGDA